MTHALEVLWRDAPVGAPLTALAALGLTRLPRRAIQGALVAVAVLLALVVLVDHRAGHAVAPRTGIGGRAATVVGDR